jgi:hypothetical protein
MNCPLSHYSSLNRIQVPYMPEKHWTGTQKAHASILCCRYRQHKQVSTMHVHNIYLKGYAKQRVQVNLIFMKIHGVV